MSEILVEFDIECPYPDRNGTGRCRATAKYWVVIPGKQPGTYSSNFGLMCSSCFRYLQQMYPEAEGRSLDEYVRVKYNDPTARLSV